MIYHLHIFKTMVTGNEPSTENLPSAMRELYTFTHACANVWSEHTQFAYMTIELVYLNCK